MSGVVLEIGGVPEHAAYEKSISHLCLWVVLLHAARAHLGVSCLKDVSCWYVRASSRAYGWLLCSDEQVEKTIAL